MASDFSREVMVQLGRQWQRAGSAAANAKRLGCDSELPKHHLPIGSAIDGNGSSRRNVPRPVAARIHPLNCIARVVKLVVKRDPRSALRGRSRCVACNMSGTSPSGEIGRHSGLKIRRFRE